MKKRKKNTKKTLLGKLGELRCGGLSVVCESRDVIRDANQKLHKLYEKTKSKAKEISND